MAAIASIVTGLLVSMVGVFGLNAAWHSRDALELFSAVVILSVGAGSIALVFA